MDTMTQELTAIDQVAALTIFDTRKVDDLVERIKIEARSIVSDPKTAIGRAEMRSNAHKVSVSKQVLLKLGRSSVEKHRDIVKGTTVVLSEMEKDLNALRDELKQPAIDWDWNNEARINKIHVKIDQVIAFGERLETLDTVELNKRIDTLDAPIDFNFEEFTDNYEAARFQALDNLTVVLPVAEIREKNAAELKRFQDAEAKRLAEQAIVDAEKARVERDRLNAVRIKKADALREIETEKRLKQAKLEERARIKRIADRKTAKAEYDLEIAKGKEEERVANKKHRKNIQYSISSSLQDGWNLVPRDSQEIIQAIESGQIPHLKIQY